MTKSADERKLHNSNPNRAGVFSYTHMNDIRYLDLDLQLTQATDGSYRAQIVNSPGGEASANFKLPFSDQDLEIFLLRIGRPRQVARRLDSPETGAAKAFGGKLFDAIFAGDLRSCFQSSWDQALQQGEHVGLRVRLRLGGAQDLNDLPWEFLYNEGMNRFLNLSNLTPVVRFLDLPEPIRPFSVQPPLNVLLMIASPSDYDALDVEKEFAQVNDATRDLQQRGVLTLTRLAAPTLDELRRQLRRGEYHIFHFIGHGGFVEQSQDGVLVLQDERGKGQMVSGQDLAVYLNDHHSLRLAILNACEGARAAKKDPFSGVAQSLVQQGLPAVIAMQFEITDGAAITFAGEFYSAIADNYPVDAALAEARKAIASKTNSVEWATPVLYLRAADAKIFSVSALPAGAPRKTDTTADASNRPAPTDWRQRPMNYTQAGATVAFEPVGKWQIQVADAVGSLMIADFKANGVFEVIQTVGTVSLQGVGQWTFNPPTQILQMQGLINGFQPFMLAIQIQRQDPEGYLGQGSDGIAYFLTKSKD